MAKNDDGLPATWICLLAVITMPFWLPPVWLIAAALYAGVNWRIDKR